MSVDPRPFSEASYAAIRYGYGFTQRPAPRSAAHLIARLEQPDAMAKRYKMLDLDAVRALHLKFVETRRVRRESDAAGAAFQRTRGEIRKAEEGHLVRALARIVDTEDPFRERLTWFWADHFTARGRALPFNPMIATYIDEAIRPHITGRFTDMLVAVVTHPAMLLYLDQVASFGPNSPRGLRQGRGLNENLAREILELHTLGVGAAYTQADVTEFAELLTGLSYNPRNGPIFDPDRAEPGMESVLGVQYGGAETAEVSDIRQALEDIAIRPETASHVCTKIAAHFIAEDPDPGLVGDMIDAYRGAAGSLLPVYGAMLAHPKAWQGMGAKIKLPFDFIASALVALRVPGRDLVRLEREVTQRQLMQPLRNLGQPFLAPPGPDGWPETEADWINPQGLAERITWAMRAPAQLRGNLPDPRRFVATALSETAGPRTIFAAGAAETRADGIGLVLASPEFNRR